MFKNVWFQTHWFLGISAGVVLAVIGVTGAALSFEPQILRWLNPSVMTVPVEAEAPLPPSRLLDRVRAAAPDKTIIGLTLAADPTIAAQVGFAGGRRGDWHYLNPYTGELLGKPERGEDFLHLMEEIHRRLAAGDTGKQIIGACTVMLLVLALSGLYLRWPRRAADWRAWLTFSWTRKGRSFLWDLHSVIGTWLLPLYLLAALTGLYWSYDWYRDGLFALTGAPRPTPPAAQMQAPAAGAANPQKARAGNSGVANAGAANTGSANTSSANAGEMKADAPRSQSEQIQQKREPENSAPAPTVSDHHVDQLWQTFLQHIPAGFQTATLRLPERAGQPAELRYFDAEPAHSRASNTLKIDIATFSVQAHERYDALPAGGKLMRSMFALHSGGFFGLTGLLLMMIASLLMPLFAITGWMLYLDRRGKKRAAKQAAQQSTSPKKAISTNQATADRNDGQPMPSADSTPTITPTSPLLIAYASQTGFAEQLAWQSAGLLQAAGLSVQVQSMASVDGTLLQTFQRALFVVSTFGDGEAPDSARRFAKRVLQHSAPPGSPHMPTQNPTQQTPAQPERSLANLRYAVLALGDQHYPSFCGFGRAVDSWLQQHGAQALFSRIEVDQADPQAIASWQKLLRTFIGGNHGSKGSGMASNNAPNSEPFAFAGAPEFRSWTLSQREHLNPGSQGAPMFQLHLLPTDGDRPVDWRAGDLLDVLPRQSAAVARAMRIELGLAPETQWQGEPIEQWLSRHECPTREQLQAWRALLLSELAAKLQPLQPRSYSIASIPADGSVQLLVRQELHGDGSLGIGSGWLTAHMPVGATVSALLRSNPGFHGDDAEKPMVLIGNGSGLSALRGHLREAAVRGSNGHWLIFGERAQQTDFYYQSEIRAWLADGTLAKLDLAFSRDQPQRVYVQDKLRENADTLKAFVAAGANLYVCGSAQGMAPAVEQVLLDVLGIDVLSQLLDEGRYRRDIY